MGTQQSHLDARRAHGEAAKAHAWAEKLSRTDQDAEHHHQQAEKHGRSAERHTYLAREASRSSWGEARAEARSARGARAGVEDKEPQKGDVEGHEFHGNQHTGGMGRLAPVADKADRVHLNSRVNEFPQKIQDKMNAECKARLGVTPEEMRDNALAAAEKCSEKDIADGKAWYQEAHDFNSKLADDTKLHPEIVTAVTAATSAGQRWEDNKEISQTICRSVTSDEIRGTGIDKETSEYLAIRGVNVEEGTKMGDLFDNNPHAAAIALQYQNGWAAGRGYDGIEKAIVLAGHNDVSRIDSELGGPKIRSFFNCMSDPAGNREDVCIDSHAYDILVNGAGSQEGYDRMASLHEGNPHLGNTPTYQGVRVGVYPVAADAFRQAADKYNEIHGTKLSYHEFQAMTWIRQGRVYPDSAMKEITMRSEIGQYKGDEE